MLGLNVTLFITPLQWLAAFESMDLSFGPSEKVPKIVHRRQTGTFLGAPPSVISQSKDSPFSLSLFGSILPNQGSIALDDNSSFDCDPACSMNGSVELLQVRSESDADAVMSRSLKSHC